MNRGSQQLKSWPPGLCVGSVMMETRTRSPRRDGPLLVVLAVCGFCLGYAITEWACDSSPKPVAARAVQRQRDARPAAVIEAAAPTDAGVAREVAMLAAVVITDSRSPAANPASLTPKRSRAAASTRREPSQQVPEKLSAIEEPSPVVSPKEVSMALTLAAAAEPASASPPAESRPSPQGVVLQPSAAASASVYQAAKLVAIEALHVEGALPSKVVGRGVQRLLPHYDRCRELCASAPQRLKLSTIIDEAGHGRQVTVEGLSRPGLRRCLEQATARLVVPAPDTGTARARWIVRFAWR